MPEQCKGFLFDPGGTLVDSMAVVEPAWCNWADRFGILKRPDGIVVVEATA